MNATDVHINRIIEDKLQINTTGDSRIELTTWKPIGYERCDWIGISLTPGQAIELANTIRKPPKPEPIEMAQGGTEIRPMWQVYRVKHGNGVTRGMIGVCFDDGVVLGLDDSPNAISQKDDKTGLKDYFWCNEVRLSSREVKLVTGLLYFWAGAMMVGTRKISKTTTRHVLNINDRKD
jgi:hypothetical protein